VAEEQLVPTLEQLYSTAQQLDIPSLMADLPTHLRESGLCQLTIVTITDISSGLQAELPLLAAARQLAHLQRLNFDSFKQHGAAFIESFRQHARDAEGSKLKNLSHYIIHFGRNSFML